MKKWKGQIMRKFVTVKDDCTMIDHFPEDAGFKRIDFGHGWLLEGAESVIAIFAMSTQAQDWHWHIVLSEIDGPATVRSGEFNGREISWTEQLSRLELNINMSLTDLTREWLPRYLPSVD